MKGGNKQENISILASFSSLREVGQNIFTPESMQVSLRQEHILQAQKFLSKGATATNPTVKASYWSHIIIAAKLGKRISENVKEFARGVDPLEIEFLLLLHDVGRLVTPREYLRNDFIGIRLLKSVGIPLRIIRKFPSLGKLLIAADEINFTEKQLTFEEPLSDEQNKTADKYFQTLSPTQRIVNLADNLGKNGLFGIFTYQQFITYLKNQENRYPDHNSSWASIHWAITDDRRRKGAVLQAYIVERTVQWLESMGVDFGKIWNELANYGPRFVVIARHGEVNNPNNIVYNRDSEMTKDDIIHLSNEGKHQMKKLGQLISLRGLNVIEIQTSPETRTKEASKILASELDVPIHVSMDLDDSYTPGPYYERMKMEQLIELGGNVYGSNWEKYQHESQNSIIDRMTKAFWKLTGTLKSNEAGVLVSHGDPIAWLANTLMGQTKPRPEELRQRIYPAKAEGLIAVINNDDTVFTLYTLKDDVKHKTVRNLY